MNTSQLGFDLFLERDECKADEEIFRENLFNEEFSFQNSLFKTDSKNIEANFGSLKQSAEVNFDPFDNCFVKPEASSPPLDLGFDVDVPDFSSLKELGDFITFDDGILNDFNESASDSGISSHDVSPDTLLSPSSGFTSPDPREDMSVDTNDTNSEVSSASDLGSLGSLGNSPERIGANTTPVGVNNYLANCYNNNKIYLDDDEDMPEVNSQNSIVLSDQLPNFGSQKASSFSTHNSSSNIIQTTTTVIPRIKFETVDQSKLLNLKNTKAPLVTKVRIDNSFSGTKSNSTPTYVVTQAGKGTSLLSNGTILKSPIGGRSLLLPVKLNDLNKVRTIKIISTSSANSVKTGTGVRTVVSTSRPATTLTSTPHSGPQRATAFFTTTKGSDGRPLLKVAPTAFVSPNATCSVNTELRKGAVTPAPAVYTIKEEPDNSDDEIPTSNQRLLLSDEEKRMMRKEGLVLPSHLPLTKQEERDLKRIKRKIRNKISAQDSRKRKKEYVDGLEDRIKLCTDENQQLQKRIRHLEKQNETLVVQLKRFHNLLGNTSSNNRHAHASTALMMLILSAALIVVPSIRPSSQDGQGENELSLNTKIPSSGHSRSLLEVGTNQKITINNPLDVFDSLDEDDLDPLSFTSALSDHDYAPLAKKPHLESDHNPFLLPTGIEKAFSKADGDPPDGKGGTSGVAALFGAMLEKFGSNRTDPGGFVSNLTSKTPQQGSVLRNTDSSVVVNLSRDRRFRDDIELE